MKTKLAILCSLMLVLPLSAEFESWTNTEGKSLELNLLEVTGRGAETAGLFAMKNGKKVTIKKSNLSEESAKLFEARRPAPVGPASTFDSVLDKNMVILDGEVFVDHYATKRPKKYYIFYYTASWCGPCKAFSPRLVEFYNNHKNENFEIVLISSDRDEKSMESYAAKNKMPWPQLKFDQRSAFKTKFNHGVRGIPSVIVCDLEGKIVTSNGRDLTALEQLVK
jgi:thiol-disulfide isomerase/thioredoxin